MRYVILFFLFFIPAFIFAQGIQELITSSYSVVDLLIPIAVGVALLAFFWGLSQFILHKSGGSETARSEGSRLMVWGIIALFVIVSIWGIIALIQSEFNISPTTIPTYVLGG